MIESRQIHWSEAYDFIRRNFDEGDLRKNTLSRLASMGHAAGENFPWRMKNGNILFISPAEGIVPFLTVGWTCFTTGEWEPNIERCLKALLKETDHVVDVGANLGYFTTSMAQLVPSGRVFGFEPLKSAFERLSQACDFNRLRNVTLFRQALSSTEGTGQLYAHETATGNASLIHDPIARLAKPHPVEMTTLDKIYRDGTLSRVDVLKIDVEGHELEVFRGGRQLLGDCKPHLIFEFNERMSRLAGWDQQKLAELLASVAKYRFYRIDDFQLSQIDLPDLVVKQNTHIDILALSPNRPAPDFPGL